MASRSIFISYSHVDEEWKDKLLVHLKAAFGSDFPVEPWNDRRIGVGDAWRQEIEKALASAEAAVLVVSADFLASDFIQQDEVPILLERHRREGLRLLPLLVRDCPWKRSPWLSSLQMCPLDARPLSSLPDVDTVLSTFATEVATLLERILPSEPPAPRAGFDPFRTINTPQDGEVPLWRKIPAGQGIVGSRQGEGRADETPQHRVEITRPFWMSAVPITNAQYAVFERKRANLDRPSHPVVNVTWAQATAFCSWLAEERGFSGARLPTEEEWEIACRAGSDTAYWNGDDEADLAEVGWYEENSESRVHAVGEKPANPWGLYDMHGNVFEWTASVSENEKYQRRPSREPFRIDPAEIPADLAAAPGVQRVVRGGCYWLDADRARSAYRGIGNPQLKGEYGGFRVLLPAEP